MLTSAACSALGYTALFSCGPCAALGSAHSAAIALVLLAYSLEQLTFAMFCAALTSSSTPISPPLLHRWAPQKRPATVLVRLRLPFVERVLTACAAVLQNVVFAALVHLTSALLPHALALDAGDLSAGAIALLGLLSPNVALRFFFQSLHDAACTRAPARTSTVQLSSLLMARL